MRDQAQAASEHGRPEFGAHRPLFHMPDDVAYFNTASMGPGLHRVRRAGERALALVTTPWEIANDGWFTDVERLREGFAGLVGTDDSAVALVPSASYGLAVAAQNLRAGRGDRVIVLAGEFPSSFYTWRRFCARTGAELVEVVRDDELGWTGSVVAAIDERTRVVSVPHVHWTNGALLDLETVSSAARSVSSALVIDASQSLGALPLDLATVRPDFLVAVGYKWLLGPVGLSYLYVDPAHRDGDPLEENWINRAGSEEFASLIDYSEAYRPGSRRFDFGERTAFVQVAMANAAIDQLNAWGVAAVGVGLAAVTNEICRRAERLGLAAPAGIERGPHMVGLEVPQERAMALDLQLAKRGVIASVRGNSLRLAPHLHVTDGDIERLLEGVAAAL